MATPGTPSRPKTPKTPKTRKLISKVWDYFKRLDDGSEKAQCNKCDNLLDAKGGSTSTLMKHLKIHGIDVSERPKSPAQYPYKSGAGPNILNFMSPAKNVPKMSKKCQEYNDINSKVADFIIGSMRPVSTVEEKPFRDMCEALNPRYPVVCRATIKDVIRGKYQDDQKKNKAKIASEFKEGIAITTDGWTALTLDGYLCLTGHGINDNWELQALCLEVVVLTERHTADYLGGELKAVCDRWGLDPVRNRDVVPVRVRKVDLNAIVTDNAANITKAVSIVDVPNPTCFGHNLQLGITAGMAEESVKEFMTEAKEMVTYFHVSSPANHRLKVISKASGLPITTLKQECPTRWSSGNEMLRSLHILKEPVCTILIQDKRKVPDESFWVELAEFLEVLKPLAIITARMSGDKYPTMGNVYAILIDLVSNKLHVNTNDGNVVTCFKTAMLDKIEAVFQREDVLEIMQISAVLDPRFKHLAFLKPGAQRDAYRLVKEKGESLSEATPSPSNSPPEKRTRAGECGELDDEDLLIYGSVCLNAIGVSKQPKGKTPVDIEIDNYKAEPGCASVKDCPLEWWKTHDQKFPILSRLAKKYLAIPATSVPSERVFSDGTNIITKKRASMDPEFAVELIVLHGNRYKE